jgi:hypothetical protein
MDAFNAAGRFGQQALGYLDEYNREKADARLRNIPADFHIDLQDRMRDKPFNFQGDPDDLEGLRAYTNKYIAEMDNFKNEWFTEKTGEKNVPYVKRRLDQIKAQAMQTVRDAALKKQDEWRVQRAYINYDENTQKAIDGVKNGDLTLQQGVEMIHNNIEYLGTQNNVSAQEKHKMRASAETSAYKEFALSVMGQVHDVNGLPEAMKRVREAAANLPKRKIYTYDEKGNVTGTKTHKTTDRDGNEIETEEHPWSFGGRDEWEKKLIDDETERIQGEHFKKYRELQAQMERMLASGVNIERVIEFARIHGAEWNRYYNSKNKEYANTNEKYLAAGENFFNTRTLEGYSRHGSGSSKAMAFDVNPGRFIRAVLPGGGNFVVTGENGEGIPVENMREAWEEFIYLKEQAFRTGRGEAGYGAIADSDWADEREKWFGMFKNRMKEIIQEDEHKSLWKSYNKLLDYDTYNDKKTSYYIKEGKSEEEKKKRNLFIQDCVSLTMDLLWNGVTDPVELDSRVKAFIVGDIEKNMKWNKTPGEKGKKFDKLAAWDKEVMEGKGKDLVFSKTRMETAQLFSNKPGEDDLVWRHENFKNDAYGVRDEEWRYAAIMLGLPQNKLNPGWMTTEDKENDPIAKGVFTVESGDEKGTYRMGYDENSNMLLLKKNDEGKWERTEHRIDKPPTKAEEKKKETQKTVDAEKEERERKRTRDAYGQKTRAGKDPLTGENFDISKPPPDFGITEQQWNNPMYLYENAIRKEEMWALYFMKRDGIVK